MGQPLNKKDFKNLLAAASSNMEWALGAAKADDRPYVAGFGQGPAATSRPAAAKGKKRAASVPAASVSKAMDLGYERSWRCCLCREVAGSRST